MSEEQLQRLLEAIKVDSNLRSKLASGDPSAAVEIAKEAGFAITAEEFENAPGLSGFTGVTEEELEGVSGGGGNECNPGNHSASPDCTDTAPGPNSACGEDVGYCTMPVG